MVTIIAFIAGLVLGYLFRRNSPKKSAMVDQLAGQVREKLDK